MVILFWVLISYPRKKKEKNSPFKSKKQPRKQGNKINVEERCQNESFALSQTDKGSKKQNDGRESTWRERERAVAYLNERRYRGEVTLVSTGTKEKRNMLGEKEIERNRSVGA